MNYKYKYISNPMILLFVTFFFLVTNSCKNEEDELASDFKVVKTLIEESPVEIKGTIELSSPDFEFKVTHDWCKVTKNGNILNLEATKNYDYRNRSTEVTITSGNKIYRVPVTQRGILFEFTSDKFKSFNFGLIGGERSIRVLSNVEYELIISEEDKEWITVVEGEDGAYNLIIAKAKDRRNGTIIFKYYEKELKIDIRQYDYYSYEQVLGPAKMTYINSRGDTITTDVEFIEKVRNESFSIKGTFESGIEREIPIKYVESADGELRFHTAIIKNSFTDTEVSDKIKTLSVAVVYTRKGVTQTVWDRVEETAWGAAIYYPAAFNVDDEGVIYKFKHSELGFPPDSKNRYVDKTLGICVVGSTATGGLVSGAPKYDRIFDIKITKELIKNDD